MESYDYLHALALAGVALYLWRREPIRLLVTPLMLLSFFVLYGVGNIVYFAGADTVPDVRADVTLSLVIMWAGLLLGVEIARAASPGLTRLAESTVRGWSTTSLTNQPEPDRILALTGLLIAGFVFAVFFGFGKPGQVLYFLALDGAREKQKFRLEMSGQGGYLYQVLIASIGPFLSFLLLIKARITRGRLLRVSGLLLCAAVLAGKVGTFQKVPWLVYLLQLLVVSQATRRLRAGFGRLLLLTALVLAGSAAATAIALPDIGMGILEFLAYRFFEVNNEVVYQTLYVYPQHLPHTWGMNIGLIHSLFAGGELTSAHTQVANFFGAEGATFDAFFIGDAWVDFGFAGVALMSVLVGWVVKTIDLWVLSQGKTPLAVALIGSGMYGLFQLQVTSAFTAFLSGGLLFIPLLILLVQALYNDLSRGHLQWQA